MHGTVRRGERVRKPTRSTVKSAWLGRTFGVFEKDLPMTITELAKHFTSLLKKNDHEAAAKHNADNIVSYEAMDGPMAVCRGRDAVQKKSNWWRENHEVHGGSVEGPYVNGDQFVVRFAMDVTPKATGKRMKMYEMGVYTVREWKNRLGALLLPGVSELKTV
jgi:hypothetical protein